jgi:CubicO group peptidase (beta-lactamase class C family)
MPRSPALLALIVLVCCAASAFAEGGTFPSAAPETVGLSSPRLARLDLLMRRALDEKTVAGGILLVARHGKIAYLNCFGLAAPGKPVQKDTIFRIASMTKPVTSTAVMLLYEEGRLLLSDPVSKYIPEFKNPMVLEMAPPVRTPPTSWCRPGGRSPSGTS